MELSTRKYNLAIGLVLLWGFVANVVMCTVFRGVFSTWNPFIVLLCYAVMAAVGSCISLFVHSCLVKFIGYNLVVLPVGVVLSICLRGYWVSSVVQAFILTASVTLLMIVISSIKPEVFRSLGLTLFLCLMGVVVVEIVMIAVGKATPRWWDWLVALLFCGYIGYDWVKAQDKPKTLGNAVSSASDLYLDILNLFLAILGDGDFPSLDKNDDKIV